MRRCGGTYGAFAGRYVVAVDVSDGDRIGGGEGPRAGRGGSRQVGRRAGKNTARCPDGWGFGDGLESFIGFGDGFFCVVGRRRWLAMAGGLLLACGLRRDGDFFAFGLELEKDSLAGQDLVRVGRGGVGLRR